MTNLTKSVRYILTRSSEKFQFIKPIKFMEIRHHTKSSIEALLERAKRELNERFFNSLERVFRAELNSGHALDTIYTTLNRVPQLLTYVQKLGKSLDYVTLDDINTFLASKLNPSTKHC